MPGDHEYFAIYFKQWLTGMAAWGQRKDCWRSPRSRKASIRLWELHQLDHSMEALVIQERFRPLFTEEEIAGARRRLDELGYYQGK